MTVLKFLLHLILIIYHVCKNDLTLNNTDDYQDPSESEIYIAESSH